MMTPENMRCRLWLFPASEFDDWREFVGGSELACYEDYLDLLDAAKRETEARDLPVEIVHWPLAVMAERLEEFGLPNTPDGRATAIAMS